MELLTVDGQAGQNGLIATQIIVAVDSDQELGTVQTQDLLTEDYLV